VYDAVHLIHCINPPYPVTRVYVHVLYMPLLTPMWLLCLSYALCRNKTYSSYHHNRFYKENNTTQIVIRFEIKVQDNCLYSWTNI